MIDYRTYLTGLVAVFLALGLGMLVGAALVGSPSTKSQQQELRELEKSFQAFREQDTLLRSRADDTKARLLREDYAFQDILPGAVGGKLAGRRVAIVLCGEIDDTGFLGGLGDTLEAAGAIVASTTRVPDDWLPADETRDTVAQTLAHGADGRLIGQVSDAKLAALLARAIATGNAPSLAATASLAKGLRLDGDYTHPTHAILLISGATTPERQNAARLGLTPETGLLNGLSGAGVRVVAAEPDGDEALSIIPGLVSRANTTVDNIDMLTGQISAVYGLAGRDGRFGIKRAAERSMPSLTE